MLERLLSWSGYQVMLVSEVMNVTGNALHTVGHAMLTACKTVFAQCTPATVYICSNFISLISCSISCRSATNLQLFHRSVKSPHVKISCRLQLIYNKCTRIEPISLDSVSWGFVVVLWRITDQLTYYAIRYHWNVDSMASANFMQLSTASLIDAYLNEPLLWDINMNAREEDIELALGKICLTVSWPWQKVKH